MAFVGTLGTFTPYSTVTPLISGSEASFVWAPALEQERVASYQKYEELYWNNPTAFRLEMRGSDLNPIYVPNPRAIVDSTAHFLMKGVQLKVPSEQDQLKLNKFLKREEFYTRFHTAKHSGVVRGDYIFHIYADPRKPEGSRVCLVSVDPGSYFPLYSEDDPDTILGIDIVDQFMNNNAQSKVLRQRYRYMSVQGRTRVTTELLLLEPNEWWDDRQNQVIKTLVPEKLLPESITTIPVYHFCNIDWQGQLYGSSELRGFERILSSINQSTTDEDTALALEGLGVYATDAPTPTDDSGAEEEWEISPGKVLEIPNGSKFERVAGVGSIKPFQDHLNFLSDALMDSSGTFQPQKIDVQVAQSGIALAIRFLPTMAKIEQREAQTEAGLQQMFFDWAVWEKEYENESFSVNDFEVDVVLDDKLPKNKVERLNELNNMVDRRVISKSYYRRIMQEEFGYQFPDNIEQEILSEQQAVLELQQQFTPVQPNGSGGNGVSDQSGTKNRGGPGSPPKTNRSNNKNKPNESAGTEAK
jgi:hypothetical protein